MKDLLERIQIDLKICHGKTCIKGTRIRKRDGSLLKLSKTL
ncbi:MAG TPA: DUF433 domain-containing protein [bacterium (Candidatus Stahlbacteria)]|nr:DUF433 domain-containing protein [Candidatus Stahlbacteria bacterium]